MQVGSTRFRMEMDKGKTKIQATLSERLSKIDVLVDKLHEDQKVTKGLVTKLEKDHADHQAAILDVCEEMDQKYKRLEDAISKLEDTFYYYETLRFPGGCGGKGRNLLSTGMDSQNSGSTPSRKRLARWLA
jgi:hypothetical protein